jgi:tRNA threonylcarbamoyladenosine biosynthesis protein TsaB
VKLLAIDTATEACSVALLIDGEIRECFEIAGREHSQKLPAMFAGLLAEAGMVAAQLDGLVAGIGPGSFAGVRIGVAFVKGLSLGLDRPAVGISSLAMLAQAAVEQGADWALPAIDARMDQVYVASYRAVGGLALACDEAAVLSPQQWSPLPSFAPQGKLSALGSGWQAWGDPLLERLPRKPDSIDASALPHARDALRLALPIFELGRAVSAAQLLPNYLRNRVALTQAEQIAARLEAAKKPV